MSNFHQMAMASAAAAAAASSSPSSQDDPMRKVSLEPDDEDDCTMATMAMSIDTSTVASSVGVRLMDDDDGQPNAMSRHSAHRHQQQQQQQRERSARQLSAYGQQQQQQHQQHQPQQHQQQQQQYRASSSQPPRVNVFAQLAKQYVQRLCAEVYECYTPRFQQIRGPHPAFNFSMKPNQNIAVHLQPTNLRSATVRSAEADSILLTVYYPIAMEVVGDAILRQSQFVQSLISLGSLRQQPGNNAGYVLQATITLSMDDIAPQTLLEYDDFRDTVESLIDTAEFIQFESCKVPVVMD